MKQTQRKVLACLLTICLLLGCLAFLTDLLERKVSTCKYTDFFKQEEPFDVLFFGTSHGACGFLPMEMWDRSGIVSYNLSCHSGLLPVSYWLMQLSLQYTKPSVVVIDCLGLNRNDKTPKDKIMQMHIALDAFPFSLTKLRAVLDLLNDEYNQSSMTEDEWKLAKNRIMLELLWDFSVYHSRWKELKEEDFFLIPNYEKGADERGGFHAPELTEKIEKNVKLEEDTVGIQYLERIITDCQKRGIEVLLVFLPFPANELHQSCANRVYDIAEEYGVRYINFLDMDVVDLGTDCYDATSHLNSSGAKKVADYLGRYLTEQYRVPDRRSDERYAEWNDDYLAYRQFMNETLRSQRNLNSYLTLLTDRNYDILLEIGDRRILDSVSYRRQLENIGVNAEKVPDDSTSVYLSSGKDVLYEHEEQAMGFSLRITVTDTVLDTVADIASIPFVFDSHQHEPLIPSRIEHLSIDRL